MNPADWKDDDVVRYAKGIVAEKAVDPMASGITWAEERLAHTIVRLVQRITWLENEIDMIDKIATAATSLMNAPLDGRELYIRKVIDAARTYRDGSLNDDGTEP